MQGEGKAQPCYCSRSRIFQAGMMGDVRVWGLGIPNGIRASAEGYRQEETNSKIEHCSGNHSQNGTYFQDFQQGSFIVEIQ